MANKRYPVNDKIINVLNIEKEQEDLLNQMEDNKSIHFYDGMKGTEINNNVEEIKNKETFGYKDRFILILIILTISTLCKICRNTDENNKNNNKINIDDTEDIGATDTEDIGATDTNEKCENNKFSLNRLDDLINAGKKYEGLLYLQNFLEEIGTGFSRIVFQYGTNQVIKYDCNPKNYEPSQNTVELDCFSKLKSPILPIIYKNGKNNDYLVCEKVEKIQGGDFQKILQIPFGDDKIDGIGESGVFKSIYPKGITVKKFIHIMENLYSQKPKNNICLCFRGSLDDLILYKERKKELENISETENKLYNDLAINHPRFKELALYIKYVVSTYDVDYCDLSIQNFGVVIRDGKPSICILDSGRSGPI